MTRVVIDGRITGSVNKISKNEAYTIVEKVKLGGDLSPVDIDKLLLYFAPNPSVTRAKDSMSWLALMVSEKDYRKYLEYIWVWNGVAYATDGHKMGWAKVDLPDGAYEPKTLSKVDLSQCKKEVGEFTEAMGQRLISKVMKHPVIETGSLKSVVVQQLNTGKYIWKQAQFKKATFDYNYLVQATAKLDIKISVRQAEGYPSATYAVGEHEFGSFIVKCILD